MAIPGRLWPDQLSSATDGVESTPDLTDVEAASETFDLLSDAARLEILAALYGADEPLAYTDLQAETSVEDNGRFNYHLRRLTGEFVTGDDDGYALTARGAATVETAFGESER